MKNWFFFFKFKFQTTMSPGLKWFWRRFFDFIGNAKLFWDTSVMWFSRVSAEGRKCCNILIIACFELKSGLFSKKSWIIPIFKNNPLLTRWRLQRFQKLIFLKKKKFDFQTPIYSEVKWIRPWFWLPSERETSFL